jgi:glycosyltransferase involved in cell wall biosynthesis
MLLKISIITVVYNCVNTLEETVLSVIYQDFDNFEFIIIDGRSSDGTIEIIKKYQDRITLWISEPDMGIYDAMNKGIKFAKGDYLYFLGGDDLLFSNSVLSNISSRLTDKNEIYYGDVLFKTRNVIYDGKFSSLKIATRNISHQSIFYPKEIFNKYSYDSKYRIFADYDLNLKLYGNSSYSFVYMPITVALFNDEGSSGSNVLDECFEGDRLDIIKKNFPYWVYLYRMYRSILSKLVHRL